MLQKLISGRFIWSVICAYVFMQLAINGLLEPNTVKEIIMMIVIFYFTKDRKENKNG